MKRWQGLPLNENVNLHEELPQGATLRIELEVVKIVSVQHRMDEDFEVKDESSIFEKVDVNHDNQLTIAEIVNWFARVKHHGVPSAVYAMDKDGDGVVTWEEFDGPKGDSPHGTQ